MKKLILTIVCATAVSGAAFAQGLINWGTPSGDITAITNDTVYSPLFGGGSANGTSGNIAGIATGLHYDFALLYQAYPGPGVGGLATDTTVWDGTWQTTGLTATNGTFAHNLTPVNTGTQTITPLDTTQSVVLVGWSANLGSSWTVVSNVLANWATLGSTIVGVAYFGESTFGYLDGNTSPAPGASVFGTGTPSANGQPIFDLNMPLYALPVPEPATIALAGLGGLSLLLFRRRKV